jgi:hypothetical protein
MNHALSAYTLINRFSWFENCCCEVIFTQILAGNFYYVVSLDVQGLARMPVPKLVSGAALCF